MCREYAHRQSFETRAVPPRSATSRRDSSKELGRRNRIEAIGGEAIWNSLAGQKIEEVLARSFSYELVHIIFNIFWGITVLSMIVTLTSKLLFFHELVRIIFWRVTVPCMIATFMFKYRFFFFYKLVRVIFWEITVLCTIVISMSINQRLKKDDTAN